MSEFDMPLWPYAFGAPSGSGDIKSAIDDFTVEELLAFTPDGVGEHAFLYVEKRGENTEYVARLLARHAGVRQRDIGYAGMKDRQACTRQWFSIWLPGKDNPDWHALTSDNLTILQTTRHARKLKRGVLAGNRFRILIRDWHGDNDMVERQLQRIKAYGFPNYFGPQRFGRNGYNVERARALFAGEKIKREQRSLYLSAARSYLFNHMLAQRVVDDTWNRALPGDVFKLSGTNSCFDCDVPDESLVERVQCGDIDPTGALWGVGDNRTQHQVLTLEQTVANAHPDLAQGLTRFDVEADRRALRARPSDLIWQIGSDTIELSFTLPPGSFATSLLREIINYRDH